MKYGILLFEMVKMCVMIMAIVFGLLEHKLSRCVCARDGSWSKSWRGSCRRRGVICCARCFSGRMWRRLSGLSAAVMVVFMMMFMMSCIFTRLWRHGARSVSGWRRMLAAGRMSTWRSNVICWFIAKSCARGNGRCARRWDVWSDILELVDGMFVLKDFGRWFKVDFTQSVAQTRDIVCRGVITAIWASIWCICVGINRAMMGWGSWMLERWWHHHIVCWHLKRWRGKWSSLAASNLCIHFCWQLERKRGKEYLVIDSEISGLRWFFAIDLFETQFFFLQVWGAYYRRYLKPPRYDLSKSISLLTDDDLLRTISTRCWLHCLHAYLYYRVGHIQKMKLLTCIHTTDQTLLNTDVLGMIMWAKVRSGRSAEKHDTGERNEKNANVHCQWYYLLCTRQLLVNFCMTWAKMRDLHCILD